MPILKHAWTSSRIIWSTQKPKISKPQVEEHTSLRSSLRGNLDSSEYQLEVLGALQMLRAWSERGEPFWDVSDIFTSVNKRLFSLFVFPMVSYRNVSCRFQNLCFNRPFTVTPTLACVVSFIYTHNKAPNIPKMEEKKKVLATHPHFLNLIFKKTVYSQAASWIHGGHLHCLLVVFYGCWTPTTSQSSSTLLSILC